MSENNTLENLIGSAFQNCNDRFLIYSNDGLRIDSIYGSYPDEVSVLIGQSLDDYFIVNSEVSGSVSFNLKLPEIGENHKVEKFTIGNSIILLINQFDANYREKLIMTRVNNILTATKELIDSNVGLQFDSIPGMTIAYEIDDVKSQFEKLLIKKYM